MQVVFTYNFLVYVLIFFLMFFIFMKFYVLKSCEHFELIRISDFWQLYFNLYVLIIQCDRSTHSQTDL